MKAAHEERRYEIILRRRYNQKCRTSLKVRADEQSDLSEPETLHHCVILLKT